MSTVQPDPGRSEEGGPGGADAANVHREQSRVHWLRAAGFSDVCVQTLDLRHRNASFDEFFQTTLDLSRVFHDAVLARPETEIADIHASLATRFEPYTAPDGSLSIPMRTFVAVATA